MLLVLLLLLLLLHKVFLGGHGCWAGQGEVDKADRVKGAAGVAGGRDGAAE